ncbi:uridine phosphorylase [Sphaeroforma arctica JP610]|uniref:Uridine phosphorylase n=1 Tax=Sphaeroforma arctica JP610 TaxID=667725 RepID=A0A0L0G1H1_9EUKA|nr:uridine phosphorylase [Sphaeroforma arctica JP610]KNC82679.1 uridine phosphorylase [Sphaeroforma arctica JP610]|eukprot:XP_014156581.1 uridine phosphorylase [Sphaeroforma arctica JP610]
MERLVESFDDLNSAFDDQLNRARAHTQSDSDAVSIDLDTGKDNKKIDFAKLAETFYNEQRQRIIEIQNPHISSLPNDFLYHIGYASTDDLVSLFSDVKYVFTGGSSGRMQKFANSLKEAAGVKLPTGAQLADLSTTDRYSLFKVGPVLSVSHGMGMPSISILLHEITKLLAYAGATGVSMVRMGTSGGVGVEPGSVVVTTTAVNGSLEPFQRCTILGEEVKRTSEFNDDLGDLIASCWDEDTPIVRGKTMSTDDFYEGQGRLDGAICDYVGKNKMDFLMKAHKGGVRNIEMESLQFASFTHRLGIPAAMVAVALLNRLEGDQVPASAETLSEYSARPQRLLASFLKKSIPYHSK